MSSFSIASEGRNFLRATICPIELTVACQCCIENKGKYTYIWIIIRHTQEDLPTRWGLYGDWGKYSIIIPFFKLNSDIPKRKHLTNALVENRTHNPQISRPTHSTTDRSK